MRRVVITSLVLGAAVPFALLVAQQVLLHVDPESVSQFRAWWYYIWPTAVILMAAAGAAPSAVLLILGVAIIGNILAYGILGAIVTLCWKMSRGSRAGD
jgi:putative effector of murein hydrolase LrgA (UPF0299 family)